MTKYSTRPFAHVYKEFEYTDTVSNDQYQISWNSLLGVLQLIRFSDIERNKPEFEIRVVLDDNMFYYRTLYDEEKKFMPIKEDQLMSFDYGTDTEFLYTHFREFFNTYNLNYQFALLDKEKIIGNRILKLVFIESTNAVIQYLNTLTGQNVLLSSGWINKYTKHEIEELLGEHDDIEKLYEYFLIDETVFAAIIQSPSTLLENLLYARKLRSEYCFEMEIVQAIFSDFINYGYDEKIVNEVKEIVFYTNDLHDSHDFLALAHANRIENDMLLHFLKHHTKACRKLLKNKRAKVRSLTPQLQEELVRREKVEVEKHRKFIENHALDLFDKFSEGRIFDFSTEFLALEHTVSAEDIHEIEQCIKELFNYHFEKSVKNRLLSKEIGERALLHKKKSAHKEN